MPTEPSQQWKLFKQWAQTCWFPFSAWVWQPGLSPLGPSSDHGTVQGVQCLGVPAPAWWLWHKGADGTAAGWAVPVVITLQIYCAVSVFFLFIKLICEGAWRLLGTRNKAANCHILPSPFQFIFRICIGKGCCGMVSVFMAWPLTWPQILPGSSKSFPMSWQN